MHHPNRSTIQRAGVILALPLALLFPGRAMKRLYVHTSQRESASLAWSVESMRKAGL